MQSSRRKQPIHHFFFLAQLELANKSPRSVGHVRFFPALFGLRCTTRGQPHRVVPKPASKDVVPCACRPRSPRPACGPAWRQAHLRARAWPAPRLSARSRTPQRAPRVITHAASGRPAIDPQPDIRLHALATLALDTSSK